MKKEERYLKNMYYQKNNSPKKLRNITRQNIVITPPDRVLTIVVVFLVVLGLMSVFSASVPKCVNAGLNPLHYTLIQLSGIVLGYFGLKILCNFDYKKLINLTNGFAIFVICLLVMVLVTGDVINGAQRWISVGPLSLQPSEFAKPAVVMLLAKVFSRDTELMDTSKWSSFLLIIIMVLLIFKQPNLSMVILLFATSVAMYLAAGGSTKLIGGGFAAFFALGGIGSILQPYQLQRIKIWLNPDMDPLGAGYNIIQSMVGFASGGLWGCGFGASKQKLAWLPEAHTDFIFAVVGEELGFLGCLFLIGLFWTILQRGFSIASRCPDMYGKLLAVGLTFSICFQAFLNMSVASSMLPATGVPLPFISYGGSSVMITLGMIGILLNISRKKVETIRVRQDV
ncbi:MAG: putative lipid II flippase FtsW [Candidatus Gastranaerophilales bacterium]|nr:putative lipid II flippase FtsW [Candidatus Gastranaerophilales bacterium]